MLTVALSFAARAVDVVGTQVTLAWAPATGPLSGYYVIVARNGSAARVDSAVVDPRATINGSYGETVVVQAAAFGADGVAGPISPPSEPIRFVASLPAPAPPPSPPPEPSPSPSPGGEVGDRGVPRDFNGDGIADLIVRRGDTLRLWVMDGSHVASVLLLPDAPASSDLVGTGDYDGNRTSDLLWENPHSGQLVLWLLNGGVVARTGVLDRSSLPVSEEWHVGGSADFDGDGADDVMLFSRIRGQVETWAFGGGAAIARRSRLSGHKGAWSVAAAVDTDGDGRGEFVWMDELHRTLERRDPAATAAQTLGQLGAGWRVIGAGHLDGGAAARLLARNATTGATQAWTLDAQGRATVRALPSSLALGAFAGSGDYDGDGREDLVWRGPASATITLWLSRDGAPAAVTVNRALAVGSALVSGASGSDDSAFRDRFCTLPTSAEELNDLQPCLEGNRTSGCEAADLDSDGAITAIDAAIWQLRASGQGCDDAR